MKSARTLIVGIGSPHGDDQAGWLVAERLSDGIRREDVVVQIADTPARMLDWTDGVARLIVCDACRGSGEPGSLRRWTWPELPSFSGGAGGTHDLSLIQTLHIAQQLGRLPHDVVVWTIEVAHTSPMADVSIEVQGTVEQLVQRIMAGLTARPI